jgi:two-component system chemotaxis response regulator CheY
MESVESQIAEKLVKLKVLIVDEEHTMRKVTRSLLQAIGIRTVYEANDGNSGLEAIRTLLPDVVIVDWEMPSPNGPEFVKTVRSPETFPLPDVPIIMLTGHGERSRVVEAVSPSASTNSCSSRSPRRRCSRASSPSSSNRVGW